MFEKRLVRVVLVAIIVLCSLAGVLLMTTYGQQNAPTPANSPSVTNKVRDNSTLPAQIVENPPPPPPTVEVSDRYLTSPEVILTTMVIVISLLALVMEFFLLRKISRLKAEDTLRVFGVTLIIMGTLFFITAGFNSSQIAPSMGLFGTIAGYLLGKVDRKDNRGKETDDQES